MFIPVFINIFRKIVEYINEKRSYLEIRLWGWWFIPVLPLIAPLVSLNLLNASLSAQALIDSEPFLLDTTITWAAAYQDQVWPSLVFDGSNYLVTWLDTSTEHVRIHGARITRSGNILDPAGIIFSRHAVKKRPVLASCGKNSLVIWFTGNSLKARRLDQDGTILDKDALTICTYDSTNSQIFTASALFNGSQYIIVWGQYRQSQYALFFARMKTTGELLEPNGILIHSCEQAFYDCVLGYGGSNHLLVWAGDTNIGGLIVTPQGAVTDTIIFATIRGEFVRPALVFDGTYYLLAWKEYAYGSNTRHLGFQVITPSGDSVGAVQRLPIISQYSYEGPDIGFNGKDYTLVWAQDDQSIYRISLSSNGTIIDSIDTLVTPGSCPVITYADTGSILVWHNKSPADDNNIWFKKYPYGHPSNDTISYLLSTQAHYQINPSLAFASTNFLFVWQQQNRENQFDIVGKRVRKDGIILDNENILISTGVEDQINPLVVFGKNDYVSMWENHENGSLEGIRITPSGNLLEPIFTLPLNDQGQLYDLDHDGKYFAALWLDGLEPKFARFLSDGTLHDNPPRQIPRNGECAQAVFACGKETFLLVWSSGYI